MFPPSRHWHRGSVQIDELSVLGEEQRLPPPTWATACPETLGRVAFGGGGCLKVFWVLQSCNGCAGEPLTRWVALGPLWCISAGHPGFESLAGAFPPLDFGFGALTMLGPYRTRLPENACLRLMPTLLLPDWRRRAETGLRHGGRPRIAAVDAASWPLLCTKSSQVQHLAPGLRARRPQSL